MQLQPKECGANDWLWCDTLLLVACEHNSTKQHTILSSSGTTEITRTEIRPVTHAYAHIVSDSRDMHTYALQYCEL